jgi:hypothetical protein
MLRILAPQTGCASVNIALCDTEQTHTNTHTAESDEQLMSGGGRQTERLRLRQWLHQCRLLRRSSPRRLFDSDEFQITPRTQIEDDTSSNGQSNENNCFFSWTIQTKEAVGTSHSSCASTERG